ncbi:hypothetical protein [Delftia sp. ASV31]|uniref:hypothetical protein n=1 Tax=Delftia sp. ASV31 TaxID=2795113 RepID=UPI0018EAF621|nr:hypothetical protein [Delftia sp. ASV31]
MYTNISMHPTGVSDCQVNADNERGLVAVFASRQGYFRLDRVIRRSGFDWHQRAACLLFSRYLLHSKYLEKP